MAALKALVIGMALLIVAGLAVVAVTIANRTLESGGPADAALALPPGAEIIETALDGRRIALRLRLADGSMAIHVYDLDTGKRAAIARIEPGGG